MNIVKASIVILSHLSDIQEEIGMGYVDDKNTNREINFIKYLVLKCGNDLTQEIDPDEMYKKFLETLS